MVFHFSNVQLSSKEYDLVESVEEELCTYLLRQYYNECVLF